MTLKNSLRDQRQHDEWADIVFLKIRFSLSYFSMAFNRHLTCFFAFRFISHQTCGAKFSIISTSLKLNNCPAEMDRVIFTSCNSLVDNQSVNQISFFTFLTICERVWLLLVRITRTYNIVRKSMVKSVTLGLTRRKHSKNIWLRQHICTEHKVWSRKSPTAK
jgi:hypothetical protein